MRATLDQSHSGLNSSEKHHTVHMDHEERNGHNLYPTFYNTNKIEAKQLDSSQNGVIVDAFNTKYQNSLLSG